MLNRPQDGPAAGRFSAESFRNRARARLDGDADPSIERHDLPALRGDHDLNPGTEAETVRAAAVLVPVVARSGGATVLLTRRSHELPTHAGQVAFPGGKIDDIDAGPVAAALRETEEETGIGREHVEIVGFLDVYQTGTGFRVQPVVAILDPGFEARPEPGEVDEIFEVPLAFLMDPANHQTHNREWRGVKRYYYAMPYGEHYIWGATAGMLRNLYDRVYRE